MSPSGGQYRVMVAHKREELTGIFLPAGMGEVVILVLHRQYLIHSLGLVTVDAQWHVMNQCLHSAGKQMWVHSARSQL